MSDLAVVCRECSIEMRIENVGWEAIWMFRSPPAPYQIASGDLLRCPKCLTGIVTRFGHRVQHFEPRFKDRVHEAFRTGKFILVWESGGDSERFAGGDDRFYLRDWIRGDGPREQEADG
jgi:hypothetical protein